MSNDKMREALEQYHQFLRDIMTFGGKYAYLNGTVIVGDAHRLLNSLEAALQSQVSNTDGWVRELLTLLVRNDELLRMALLQLNAWQEKYGAANPAWLPPAGDVPVMEAIANIRAINKATLSAAPKAPQQVSNTPQDDPALIPLVRYAINLLSLRPPIAHHVQEAINELQKIVDGQPLAAGEPSAEWLKIAEMTAPPQQQEQSGEAVDAYNLHCETCNGHGFVMHSVRHGESDFEDFEQECPVCDGAGKAPKHVQDLQARYQEVRSELHALNTKIGMESLLGPSPATPTATASQESAPGQVTPDGYVSHDAYRGAMERAYLAEKRLHAAEEKLREESEINARLIRELNNINGPTFMGEPVLSAPGQEAVAIAECYDNGTPEGGIRWIPYSGLTHKIEVGDKFYTAPPTSTANAEAELEALMRDFGKELATSLNNERRRLGSWIHVDSDSIVLDCARSFVLRVLDEKGE
jgi:hypothetical protein